MSESKNIVVSGMRTTGQLHLGHLHGVIRNWLDLQNKYKCFIFAADLHALTTHYDDITKIEEHTWNSVIDWLACGLDPKKATIFIQSHVPEHAELQLLLSMITPLSWLERVPTYKDQQEKLKTKNLATYGFLGYPVLQSADVLLYQADFVPVGEDQLSHLELCREIARRFNHLYSNKSFSLTEPQSLLSKISKMPGLDGQKMSKSYNNTIMLRDDKKTIERKIKTMPTDPARVKRTDPGDPAKCPVWEFHKIYSDQKTCQWVESGCKSASIGCIDCKKPIINSIINELEPIQDKISHFENNKQQVRSIVNQGCLDARIQAKNNIQLIKEAMGLKLVK